MVKTPHFHCRGCWLDPTHCMVQPILEEINPEYSLEGLMLKLKLQYLAT